MRLDAAGEQMLQRIYGGKLQRLAVVPPASGHIFTKSRFQEQFSGLDLSILKPPIAKTRTTKARSDIRTFSDSLPDKLRLKVFDH